MSTKRRDFQRTTAINKMAALKKRVKGMQGGTSAGKTYGILPLVINKAAKNPDLDFSVVSESIPHLKRGAMKDFIKIMKATKRWIEERFNKTDRIYTFANGSTIEFFSADDDTKLRGARRDYLYINEANNVTFKAYQELATRTKKGIWLDWNPVASFWFHEELAHDDDAEMIILTYLDNEACPENVIHDMEKAKRKAETSAYWANYYRVYGLGLIGTLEGTIFTNWKTIGTVPREARLLGYGLDFGYTNDPTALVAVYKWNGKYIVDEVIYQTGLKNREIFDLFKERTDPWDRTGVYVWCDSAEPKSIDDLVVYGMAAEPAEKGRDSIKNGIDIMQQVEWLVTEKSTNIIKEFRRYSWAQDKTGKRLNVPEDVFNHAMDALRYFTIMNIAPRNSTQGYKTKSRFNKLEKFKDKNEYDD